MQVSASAVGVKQVVVLDDGSEEAAAVGALAGSLEGLKVQRRGIGALRRSPASVDGDVLLVPLVRLDDGLDVIGRVRAEFPTHAIVAVARPASPVHEAALRAGADEVIADPGLSTGTLADSIARAIARRAVQRKELAERAEEIRPRMVIRMAAAEAIAGIGSWELDLRTSETDWTPEMYRIVGADPDRPPLGIDEYARRVHAGDRARVVSELLALLEGGVPFDSVHRLIRPDGSVIHVNARGRPEYEHGELVRVIGVVQDISAQKAIEAELEEARDRLQTLADEDALTGLRNRRAFERDAGAELTRARRHGPRGTLYLLDVDRFKLVNDRFGHAAGDALLIELAHRLQKRFRATDVIGRLGGDEFAVYAPGAHRGSADRLAKQVVDDIARRRAPSVPASTISVGYAEFDSAHLDLAALMRRADLAMYEAKRAGGGSARRFRTD